MSTAWFLGAKDEGKASLWVEQRRISSRFAPINTKGDTDVAGKLQT
jgi:hypothetical protein